MDVDMYTNAAGRGQYLEGLFESMAFYHGELSSRELFKFAKKDEDLTPNMRTLVRSVRFSATFLLDLLAAKAPVPRVYALFPSTVVERACERREDEWLEERAFFVAQVCHCYELAMQLISEFTSGIRFFRRLVRLACTHIDKRLLEFLYKTRMLSVLGLHTAYEANVIKKGQCRVMCTVYELVRRSRDEPDDFYAMLLGEWTRQIQRSNNHDATAVAAYAFLIGADAAAQKMLANLEPVSALPFHEARGACDACYKLSEPVGFPRLVPAGHIPRSVFVEVDVRLRTNVPFDELRAFANDDPVTLENVPPQYVRETDHGEYIDFMLARNSSRFAVAVYVFVKKNETKHLERLCASACYIDNRLNVSLNPVSTAFVRAMPNAELLVPRTGVWSAANIDAIVECTSLSLESAINKLSESEAIKYAKKNGSAVNELLSDDARQRLLLHVVETNSLLAGEIKFEPKHIAGALFPTGVMYMSMTRQRQYAIKCLFERHLVVPDTVPLDVLHRFFAAAPECFEDYLRRLPLPDTGNVYTLTDLFRSAGRNTNNRRAMQILCEKYTVSGRKRERPA